MLTLVFQGRYEGSTWPPSGVPSPLWAAWGGDSPELLLSSGLLGFPEWVLLGQIFPSGHQGLLTTLNRRVPWSLSHSVKGQLHLALGLGFTLKGQRYTWFSFFHHFGEDIFRGLPGPLRS